LEYSFTNESVVRKISSKVQDKRQISFNNVSIEKSN